MIAPDRFRKKPVEIEAVQLDTANNPKDVCDWISWASDAAVEVHYDADGRVFIHTLEGIMRADDGDWIIRGVKGEFYPCKPDIFAATYEVADKRVFDRSPSHPLSCQCDDCAE